MDSGNKRTNTGIENSATYCPFESEFVDYRDEGEYRMKLPNNPYVERKQLGKLFADLPETAREDMER